MTKKYFKRYFSLNIIEKFKNKNVIPSSIKIVPRMESLEILLVEDVTYVDNGDVFLFRCSSKPCLYAPSSNIVLRQPEK